MILFHTKNTKTVEYHVQSFQNGEAYSYLHYRALEFLEVVYNMRVYEHFMVDGGEGGGRAGKWKSPQCICSRSYLFIAVQ